MGDLGSIPGLGRSPGGRHGNPLQHSCLGNPYGQKSLEGHSPWGLKKSNMTERLSTLINSKMLLLCCFTMRNFRSNWHYKANLTFNFQLDLWSSEGLKLHYDSIIQLSCFQTEACRKGGMASFQCHRWKQRRHVGTVVIQDESWLCGFESLWVGKYLGNSLNILKIKQFKHQITELWN